MNILISNDVLGGMTKLLDKENLQWEVYSIEQEARHLGFDASTIQNIILALGSAGAITAFSQVLTTFIRESRKEIIVRRQSDGYEIKSKNVESEKILELINGLDETTTLVIISREIYY